MNDPLPLPWDMYLQDVGPQPVAFAIVASHPGGMGNTTREVTTQERARIRAWIGRFVRKHGVTPIGSFDVGGVTGSVLFRRVWQ